jgi:hypothetical protein
MSGLLAHYPAIHGGQDGVRGHHLKPYLLRRFWHTAIMAARAIFLKQTLSGMFLNINGRAISRLHFVSRSHSFPADLISRWLTAP